MAEASKGGDAVPETERNDFKDEGRESLAGGLEATGLMDGEWCPLFLEDELML